MSSNCLVIASHPTKTTIWKKARVLWKKTSHYIFIQRAGIQSSVLHCQFNGCQLHLCQSGIVSFGFNSYIHTVYLFDCCVLKWLLCFSTAFILCCIICLNLPLFSFVGLKTHKGLAQANTLIISSHVVVTHSRTATVACVFCTGDARLLTVYHLLKPVGNLANHTETHCCTKSAFSLVVWMLHNCQSEKMYL